MGNNETTLLRPDFLLTEFTKACESRISETNSKLEGGHGNEPLFRESLGMCDIEFAPQHSGHGIVPAKESAYK